MTFFIRAVAAKDKAALLKEAVRGTETETFRPDLSDFQQLPGTPFAYWVGSGIRNVFSRFPPVEGEGRAVRQGLATGDDGRFLRCMWEVSLNKNRKWKPFAKGGELLPFYAPIFLVVNWEADGLEIRNFVDLNTGKVRSRAQNVEHYFKGGLTWPLRASKFAPQALPKGAIFSVRGYCALLPGGDLLPALAVFNSKPFDYIYKALLGRFEYPEFIVGILQKMPWAQPDENQAERFALMAREGWACQRRRFTHEETSSAFVLPLCRCLGSRPDSPVRTLDELQRNIDTRASELFGFGEPELQEMLRANVFSTGQMVELIERDAEDGSAPHTDPTSDNILTISWSVGVAFGRFDVRLATGERAIPPEPDPFDPLPAKSPGMLPDGDPPFMPTSGVFVDDPGHVDDLAARVTAVYARVSETSPTPDELRRTLARDFFPAHIGMYSKSRRKAPIYWQLATPSASYSVWLYIHAFSKDTLFRVQNDFVAPKLAHERRELEGLLAEAGPSPTTGQSRAIEAQSNFVEELSALLDEVRRVAPLWDPDLDDGVILNFAPLWRLVPQNRAWQKELRAAWASLVDGDCDWAHLSMRLWPERVVPKCAKDRSLAIAHDLEDVFWFEDAAGKWQARPTPTRPLDDLIADRTSTAVKAALLSLLDAPDPVAASGRGRRKKS